MSYKTPVNHIYIINNYRSFSFLSQKELKKPRGRERTMTLTSLITTFVLVFKICQLKEQGSRVLLTFCEDTFSQTLLQKVLPITIRRLAVFPAQRFLLLGTPEEFSKDSSDSAPAPKGLRRLREINPIQVTGEARFPNQDF